MIYYFLIIWRVQDNWNQIGTQKAITNFCSSLILSPLSSVFTGAPMLIAVSAPAGGLHAGRLLVDENRFFFNEKLDSLLLQFTSSSFSLVRIHI